MITNLKRPIVVMVIGYIIGIIWGLYFNFSIVLFYILIAFLCYTKIIQFICKMLYFIQSYFQEFDMQTKKQKNQKKRKTSFQLFSIHRYARYIKLIFTKQVIFLITISSIISNTILIFQENRYENLYPEENIMVEGIIVSNQEEREYKNRYKVKVLTANDSNKYQSTQIYIEVKKDIQFEYGDKVRLQGEFRKGSEQRNTGGFDYQLYLKSINIYGTLKVENYQKISSGNANWIAKSINEIKLVITENIENILEKEEAQIVKGLILGDTTTLEEELKEKFQIANISHVLAVSGMHIIYIVIGIEVIFKKLLGKRPVKYVVIIGLVFYMSITGFTSSIVRAGIMGMMNIVAFLVYRKNDIWTSIAISLGIILIQNPYAITGVGLQLSYLGTIGIILFNKNIKQYLDNIKWIKNNIQIKRSKRISKIVENLKDMISVTLSAQMMILPIMLYHFNMIGIYFVITNILVSSIIGPIMFLSIIFVFSSFIHLQISQFISIFLSLGIKGLIQISNLSHLPFSKIYIPTPSILVIIIYYIVILVGNQIYMIYTNQYANSTKRRVKNLIALIKYKLYEKKKRTWKIYQKILRERNVKACIVRTYKIILLIILLIGIYQFPKDLEIHFLDVGQGDSCFIITPNRKTILIDGGGSTSSTFDVGKDTLIPYLLDKGYTNLDYVFISHFDQDHVGGILTVLKEFKVGQIFISKQGEESENYETFLKIVEQKQLKVREVKIGDKITIGDVTFHILWPMEKQIEENILNNNAIVMKLQYKSFSMLFTGDIEEVAEKKILDTYKNHLDILKSSVLKVAHHGSKSSSTDEFLEAVNSKVAIIGVGENNMFGHPCNVVLERLQSFRHADF